MSKGILGLLRDNGQNNVNNLSLKKVTNVSNEHLDVIITNAEMKLKMKISQIKSLVNEKDELDE